MPKISYVLLLYKKSALMSSAFVSSILFSATLQPGAFSLA